MVNNRERDYSLLDQLGAIWEQKDISFAGLIKITADAIKKVEARGCINLNDDQISSYVFEELVNYKPYKIYKKELVEKYFNEKESGFIDSLSYEEYEKNFVSRGYEIIEDDIA